MKIRRKPIVTPREQFRALFPELGALKAERSGLYDLHKGQVDARLREYTGSKGGPDALERAIGKLADWEVAEVVRPIRDANRARGEELRREIAWTEARLEKLADATRPMIGPSPTWFRYRDPISAHTYSTTGNGAHYARGACLTTVALLALEGWTGRVVDAPYPHETEKPRRGLERFAVEVQLHEELDVEILKRSFAYSLKDWLRATLRNGLNPRVFQPFLPYGIEAKLGLDYFGRDLPAKAVG